MTIEQFIEKAIKGGWIPIDWELEEMVLRSAEILLDLKAWQAVGKVEGWYIPSENEVAGVLPEWKEKMHQMIDFLIKRNDLDEFLETL